MSINSSELACQPPAGQKCPSVVQYTVQYAVEASDRQFVKGNKGTLLGKQSCSIKKINSNKSFICERFAEIEGYGEISSSNLSFDLWHLRHTSSTVY